MPDRIDGALGDDVRAGAVGKGINQNIINLGDKTPGEIAQILADLTRRSDRLQIAVLGDADIGAPGMVARLQRIDELTGKVDSLADDMGTLMRALLGDDRFQDMGLVKEVRILSASSERREWWRLVSTWALAILAISQIAQWVAVWRIYALYAALLHGLQ